ncbi:8718_t:CDS:2, partial [Gigaspora rosea]
MPKKKKQTLKKTRSYRQHQRIMSMLKKEEQDQSYIAVPKNAKPTLKKKIIGTTNAEYDVKPMSNMKANVECKSQCRIRKPTRDVKPTLAKPSSKKRRQGQSK